MTQESNRKLAWLPDYDQELLLCAALANEREEAFSAWETWKKTNSLELLDGGSQRLLPLVYHNLQHHKIEDELTGSLKLVHRRAFRDNRMLFQHCGEILETFRQAQIETQLLKGVPVSILYYPSTAATRPMADIDLLIRPKDLLRTVKMLLRDGWRPEPVVNLKLYLQTFPSCDFTHDKLGTIDLHWHAMRDCWRTDQSDFFWENPCQFQFGNIFSSAEIATPSATAQLFHVCWHGARYNRLPSLRWVADAVMILQAAADEIEWSRIVEYAKFYGVHPALYHAFNYLAEKFSAPIPPEFLAELKKLPISRIEEMAFRLLSGELIEQSSRLKRFFRIMSFEYSTRCSGARSKLRVRAFAKYLQYHLQDRLGARFPAFDLSNNYELADD